jgi:hypothetical protein
MICATSLNLYHFDMFITALSGMIDMTKLLFSLPQQGHQFHPGIFYERSK